MITQIPLRAPGETNQTKTEHCQTNMPQVGGEQTIENEETRNPPDIQHSECMGPSHGHSGPFRVYTTHPEKPNSALRILNVLTD